MQQHGHRTFSPYEESTIVERVARIVSSVRGTNPDYTRLAAELEPAIPFDIFGVVLLHHDQKALRITVCSRAARVAADSPGAWRANHHQHPLQDSMVEQVLHDPVMRVSNYPHGLDGTPATSGDALSRYPHLRATFIAPLIVGERTLGTLELGSTILNIYDHQPLQRLIAAVVRVLASAIESAQTGGSAAIQDRQRHALKHISTALTSTTDLATILNRIVVGIAEALNGHAAIITFDPRLHKLRVEAQSGLELEALRGFIERKSALSDQAIIGYTLLSGQPCVSHDIAIDSRFPASRSFATDLGERSIFSYPLVIGTTVYGVLLFCSPDPGGFTPLKTDILSLFASQATIAMRTGMMLESTQQRKRFQEAIEQFERLDEEVQRTTLTDEQELIEHLRHETQQTFGIRLSSLLRFISDHLLTRSEQDVQAMVRQQQTQSLVQQKYLSGDGETLPRLHPPLESQPEEERVALLTQTAEAALVRIILLSQLSQLTQQYERPGQKADAWIVVNSTGHCLYLNTAAEEFCGLSAAAATGRPLQEVCAAVLERTRNADQLRAYLQDFTEENSETRELQWVIASEPVQLHPSTQPSTQELGGPARPTGPAERTAKDRESAPTDHHYQLRCHPLDEQNAQLNTFALQIHDITEQVRDEKNRSALLSSVSHDLRTPLTTIKAAVTGLMQADINWDEQARQEMLSEIDAETDHLTDLVNAVVDLSRIEMGSLVLEKEWCDIEEIIHTALKRTERILADRNVSTHFQSYLPLVRVDYVQLERVFYNLLEYAARYSGNTSPDHDPSIAGITVIVDVLDQTSPSTLRVRVIDSQNGVSEEARKPILKALSNLNSPFREPGSLSAPVLGLVICRGIVEAHGGRIWGEPIPTGGMCFIFTLPIDSIPEEH
jgi:PAS domain S-box-containing protein